MPKKTENSPKDQKRTIRAKELFLQGYSSTFGNVSAGLEQANVSRRTYNKWLNSDDGFADKCWEVTEKTKDFGETQLIKNIKDGKETSLIFYLKTKCKDRGYIETIHNINSEGSVLEKKVREMSDEELEMEIRKMENDKD